MSLDVGFNPFSEIEFISKHLNELAHKPDETETNKTIEKLNSVLNKQLPQLIEDVAIHPEHRKVWRNISSDIRKLDVHEFKKIQGTIDRLTHIGFALSNPERAIKMLGTDLKKYANSLKKERNIEENLRSAGLILTNYFKMFRGITVSNTPLTKEQHHQLMNHLNDFKTELNDLKEHFPEISSHPNLLNLEKLVYKLGGKDLLEFQLKESRTIPDDPKISMLKFLPPEVDSLNLIREEIKHNREIGYAAMAAWINQNKIRLNKFDFSPKELAEIQPQLRYVDFTNLDFYDMGWTEETISDYIQNCPNIETLRIRTNLIRTLPDRIKQLKELDCGGCINLTALPVMNSLLKLNCQDCIFLTELATMNSLKELNCQDCTALTALPVMNSLKDLHCKSCTALTELPELNALENLYCHSCTSLTRIPSLNSLKGINCNDCTSLLELGEMAALKNLTCKGCTALIVLPRMNSLEVLRCSECPALIQLSRMNSLIELFCEDCVALTELPEMNSLKGLLCSGCTSLTRLPRMNSIENIACMGCSALTELPAMSTLRGLNCENCIALTALPQLDSIASLNCTSTPLTELPVMNFIEALQCQLCIALTRLPMLNKLKILNCPGCTALTELPNMRLLDYLNCKGCTALTALPEMTSLKGLDCRDCTGLTELPIMMFLEQLRSERCTNITNADRYRHVLIREGLLDDI